MRFSVARYSFRRRSSSSIEPVTYASIRFQFIGPKWSTAEVLHQPFVHLFKFLGIELFELFDPTPRNHSLRPNEQSRLQCPQLCGDVLLSWTDYRKTISSVSGADSRPAGYGAWRWT